MESSYNIDKHLLQIINLSPGPVYVCAGEDLKVIYANEATLRVWGKDKSVIGKPFIEALPEVIDQPFPELLRRVYHSGVSYHTEQDRADLPVNGTLRTYFFKFSYQALKNEDGTIWGVLCIATDVSELVRARQIAEESEQRFRTMSESVDILVAVSDESSDATYFNKAWLTFTGRTIENLLAYGWADLLHPDDKEQFLKIYLTAFNRKEAFSGEFRLLRKDGVYRWMLAKSTPRFNGEGDLLGYISSSIDITERKQIEEEKQNNLLALKAANAKLKEVADSLGLALESADMGTWKADVATGTLTISEQARVIHGILPDTALTFIQTAEIIDSEFREKTLQAIDHAVKTRGKFDLEYLIKPMDGGSPKWIRSTGKAFYDQQGNPVYILGTILDVTSQKNKEETLKYRKALLEAQNEAIPDAILIVDAKGGMLSYNHHFVTMWRIPKEIIDRQDDTAALQFAMTQIADPLGFIERVNYCYAHPSEPAHEEVLFKDGRVIERFGTAVIGEDGTSYGWAWYFKDITRQRELQKQKDEFISTVSHELKTPVTSIKAYAQLLHRSLSNKGISSHEDFLARMDTQVRRLENLIRDLLDVTRVDAGKFDLTEDSFHMGEMLSDLVADLQVITPSHQLLLLENFETKIKADKGRIIQVITNLVNNAVKYSPNSDRVYISSKMENHVLTVSITDFGMGIQEEQKPFLFERFHQAERTNAGAGLNLGLGLYISKQIIDRSGGKIWLESEPGKGSTFYFNLPSYL